MKLTLNTLTLDTRENTVATEYLTPAGELLQYELLDQQSTYDDNVDNTERKQDNEKERATTPSIHDDEATSPGDIDNVTSKMYILCLSTGVTMRCNQIFLNATQTFSASAKISSQSDVLLALNNLCDLL